MRIKRRIADTKSMLENQIQTRMATKQRADNVKLKVIAHLYGEYRDQGIEGFSGVKIELKVGADKLYVVKDIYRFLCNVKDEEYVKYCKFLGFKHSLDNFEPRSRELLKYLLSIRREFNDDNTDRRYFYFEKIKKFFDLYDLFSDCIAK